MATILAESKIKHTSPVFPGDQIELEAFVEFRRPRYVPLQSLAKQ